MFASACCGMAVPTYCGYAGAACDAAVVAAADFLCPFCYGVLLRSGGLQFRCHVREEQISCNEKQQLVVGE
jgi:hypothetical protein